ncbi:MAG: DegQ family serine endoprotease [Desulfobacterales bacterium]|jgi:serine protease Do
MGANYVIGFKRNVSQLTACLIAGFLFACAICLVDPAQAAMTDTRLVPLNFSELSEMASPAVVNIRTVKTTKGAGPVFRHFQRSPWGKDHPFNDFFEKFFGEDFQREFKQRSLGSGFIIDKDGYIVTNNHVIEDADQIMVKLKNGREFEAEIVGRDANTDIALIKLKSSAQLPFVELGDSDALEVGEWVVAIGNPFGLEHTVTAGIVSAKGRVIGSGPYDDFIQTDASINPGNSGGPLLDLEGKVVGINTAIIATGQGIGFAIPMNLAKGIIEQLRNRGEVTRGWLGVAIQDLNEELAEYYGVKGQKGVLITEVFPGDPADKAGIKTKDIVIEVNGEKVTTSRELSRTIADIGVGEKAKILILRDGQKKTFRVKIAKREESKILSRTTPRQQEDELGIRVTNLTSEMARRFNIPVAGGVIVVDVESGSKGSEAGIRVGDMIKEINHEAIESVDDYITVLGRIETGETINFFIQRMNAGFLVVKLTK